MDNREYWIKRLEEEDKLYNEETESTYKELINYYESLPEDERKQLDFDTFKVSYVKPSIRKTFDSKRLQDEDIDTYNKYLKESQVSATIKYI